VLNGFVGISWTILALWAPAALQELMRLVRWSPSLFGAAHIPVTGIMLFVTGALLLRFGASLKRLFGVALVIVGLHVLVLDIPGLTIGDGSVARLLPGLNVPEYGVLVTATGLLALVAGHIVKTQDDNDAVYEFIADLDKVTIVFGLTRFD
jgi:hypothetical protein